MSAHTPGPWVVEEFPNQDVAREESGLFEWTLRSMGDCFQQLRRGGDQAGVGEAGLNAAGKSRLPRPPQTEPRPLRPGHHRHVEGYCDCPCCGEQPDPDREPDEDVDDLADWRDVERGL